MEENCGKAIKSEVLVAFSLNDQGRTLFEHLEKASPCMSAGPLPRTLGWMNRLLPPRPRPRLASLEKLDKWEIKTLWLNGLELEHSTTAVNDR